LVISAQSPAISQTTPLAAPAFHHLHLNSLDPDAAIGFYTRQFATTSKSSWNGLSALKSPNNVLVLFNKVATIRPQPRRRPRSGISAGTRLIRAKASNFTRQGPT
jgi:hypothetical protein